MSLSPRTRLYGVGYFGRGCSLRRAPRRVWSEGDVEHLGAYFRSARRATGFLSAFWCEFGCRTSPGSDTRLHIYNYHYTDGIWVWPLSFQHYVAQHGLDVPPAFLETMRGREWNAGTDELEYGVETLSTRDDSRWLEWYRANRRPWWGWR